MIPEIYVDEGDSTLWQRLSAGVWRNLNDGTVHYSTDRQLTRLVPERRSLCTTR